MSLSISAPILNFTVQDILDEEFHQQVKNVLAYWISVDRYNLDQVRTGVRQFSMPTSYQTNQCPGDVGVVSQAGAATDADLQAAIQKLDAQLQWIGLKLWSNRDFAGALRVLLLYRHLFPGAFPIQLTMCFPEISRALAIPPEDFRGQKGGSLAYALAGVDAISRMIDERYPGSKEKPPT